MPQSSIPVHDPVMIREDGTWYLFSTGNGINVFSSTDRKNWTRELPVFDAVPQWVFTTLPGYRGKSLWAPDIIYHNGLYYLYYSVSVFGKNQSCIGLAVNKTLNRNSSEFEWKDLGKVVQSVPGRDMWNAIDPNLAFDEQGKAWLTFGSFWQGIKLVEMEADLKRLKNPEKWYTLASRPREATYPDTVAGNAAIEAPFIFRKGDYYYLFVSWDYCCRGERSNYKVVVGRSKTIYGPYLDRSGVDMRLNGGTLVMSGDIKQWHGTGHNSVYTFDGKDYFICHGYDALDKGRAKLIIRNLEWNHGWPEVLSLEP